MKPSSRDPRQARWSSKWVWENFRRASELSTKQLHVSHLLERTDIMSWAFFIVSNCAVHSNRCRCLQDTVCTHFSTTSVQILCLTRTVFLIFRHWLFNLQKPVQPLLQNVMYLDTKIALLLVGNGFAGSSHIIVTGNISGSCFVENMMLSSCSPNPSFEFRRYTVGIYVPCTYIYVMRIVRSWDLLLTIISHRRNLCIRSHSGVSTKDIFLIRWYRFCNKIMHVGHYVFPIVEKAFLKPIPYSFDRRTFSLCFCGGVLFQR